MIYFLKGRLPWQNLNPPSGLNPLLLIEKYKVDTQLEVLCEGLPKEFAQFLDYTRHLKFPEEPRYEYWRNKFKGLAKKNNFEYDNIWDWTPNVN